MSEPLTRQRPSVDLDDFERRMRQSHLGNHEDDPLAELARLVGEQPDPYGDMFAHEAVADEDHGGYREDAPAPTRFPTSFAAIEAGLRGGISPHVDDHAYPDQDAYADRQAYDQQHAPYGYDEQGYPLQVDPAAYAPVAKSRRPIYLMAATIVVGVLGVGGAFALKGHSANPSDVKTIMAAAGPTKIQPPADATGDQSAQDSAILGKTSQPAPTKLVSNVEEPVDVSQAVTADNNVGSATDAASIQVPPSPGQAAASTGIPTSPDPDFAAGMPAPKKVKVVSVRPDGTILSGDPDQAAAISPGALAPEDVTPVPTVSTPRVPKVVSSPKSVTRVLPKHVAEAPADDAGDDTPPPPPKATHKVKPKAQKLAMAEPNDTSPTAAESDVTPRASSGGSFAVQLAAPGSEAEARAASSKLAKKYADALDGRHLGFFKALSNGKSVFRVRASGLSKEDATSLCDKLKADGGSCFVAKN